MSDLTAAAIVALLIGFALAAVCWQARRAQQADSGRGRIIREAHQRAVMAREIDELELIYDLPAYDPAWDPGRERLWDAIRDNHTTTEGD